MSRDSLLGLFWPELDETRGRGALNQTLHHLRKYLGHDVVVSQGTRLSIPCDQLWCDAVAFSAALEAGQDAEALALYGGDLLPGFFLDDAHEFEDWLALERSRLRRAAADAAVRLCGHSLETGDSPEGARWAFRAADLVDDELTVRSLVESLEGAGDAAAALQVCEHFETRLSAEYGLEPSSALLAAAARVRAAASESRARRSDPPALPAGDAAPAPVDPEAPTREAARSNDAEEARRTSHPAPLATSGSARRRRRRITAVVVGAVVVPTVVLYAWTRSRAVAGPIQLGATADVSIAIEPLADLTRDDRLNGLSRALTSNLVNRLAGVDGIRVAVPSQHETQADSPRAGDSQAPTFRATGEVMEAGDSVQATLRLVDANTSTVVDKRTATVRRAAVPDLAEALADSLSGFMRERLGRQVRLHEAMAGTRSLPAWKLFEQGERSLETGIDLRHAGSTEAARRALEEADSLMARAESTDRGWVAPPVERARIAFQLAWTAILLREPHKSTALLEASLRHGDRAVRVGPNNARAYAERGASRYWLVLMGRPPQDSAVALLKAAERDLYTAVNLNSRRASAWTLLSDVAYYRGDYAGSYLAASRAYDSDPYLENALDILSRLFDRAFEVGNDQEARSWCEKTQARFPASTPAASCAIRMLAWAPAPARVDSAWRLIQKTRLSGAYESTGRALLDAQVGVLLAKVGRGDSAAAVIRRAESALHGSAELMPLQAEIQLALGHRDSALQLLRGFRSAFPGIGDWILSSRRFALTPDERGQIEYRARTVRMERP